MKRLFIIAVAIACLSTVKAWVVTDTAGHPLQYVSADVFRQGYSTMTDSAGGFSLPDSVGEKETVCLSAPGFKMQKIRYAELLADTAKTIVLAPSVSTEPETMVRPEKVKTRKAGKKHSSGLMTISIDNSDEYIGAGYEFHAKKGKSLWLDKVGFYIDSKKSDLEHMKIRVSVYDMADVKKSPSSEFVDAFSKPVALFDFDKQEIRDGKFTYVFPAPIKLCDDALVVVEFVEPFGPQRLCYKSNLVAGSQAWMKSIRPGERDKFPMALPFFVECIETD